MMDVNRIRFLEQATPFTYAESKQLENGDVLPSDDSKENVPFQWRESFASWDELLQVRTARGPVAELSMPGFGDVQC